MKKCAQCGTGFDPHGTRAKVCGQTCRFAWNRVAHRSRMAGYRSAKRRAAQVMCSVTDM